MYKLTAILTDFFCRKLVFHLVLMVVLVAVLDSEMVMLVAVLDSEMVVLVAVLDGEMAVLVAVLDRVQHTHTHKFTIQYLVIKKCLLASWNSAIHFSKTPLYYRIIWFIQRVATIKKEVLTCKHFVSAKPYAYM